MRKPVVHITLYLRAYLLLLKALVNICSKAEEGRKLTLFSILVTLPQFKLTVPTGPAAAAITFLPTPGVILARSYFV